MAQTIALAGKGGVGKTTICGMLIEYLCEKRNGPVLAVDADANSNLNEVLGVEVEDTLGDIREDMTRAEMASEQVIPTGMTKADYAEMRFSDALTEADDFDLLVMGRTQGKGCYCFVNGLLTAQVSKYAKNYRYIVVDNEAGLEHLSRGVLPQVDTILLVSDCSRRGVQAAGRLSEMIVELKLGAKEVGLIINRAPGGQLNPGIQEEIIHSLLHVPGLKAVVMKTFGSGNAPQKEWFIRELKEATDRGIIIVNITQCASGAVEMGRYETGMHLLEAGVISGYDSTPECAVTKLMFLLGHGLSNKDIRYKMNSCLIGEITKP